MADGFTIWRGRHDMLAGQGGTAPATARGSSGLVGFVAAIAGR